MKTTAPALLIACLALAVALGGRASASPSPEANVRYAHAPGFLGSGEEKFFVAECPKGTHVLGGGYAMNGELVTVNAAAPSRDPSGYEVLVSVPPVDPAAGYPRQRVQVRVVASCVPYGEAPIFSKD